MTASDKRKLLESIFEDFHAVKLKMMGAHFGRSGVVTLSQGLVIGFLRREPATVSAIARHLGITTSAATQLVNGLVGKGYLIRKGNAADRRETTVALSAAGRRQMDALKAERLRKIRSLLKALNDSEVREYCRLNRKIADSVTGKKTKNQ